MIDRILPWQMVGAFIIFLKKQSHTHDEDIYSPS